MTDDLDFSTKERVLYDYESSITYHSKAMANVKSFCGQINRQMDRRTNRRAKSNMPPIYRCGGIKTLLQRA